MYVGCDKDGANQVDGRISLLQVGRTPMDDAQITKRVARTTDPRMSEVANFYATLTANLDAYSRPDLDPTQDIGIENNFGTQDEDASSMAVNIAIWQEGFYPDVFFVDNVGLFVDSILWEFSSDGGSTWYPMFAVANKPWNKVAMPETSTSIRVRASGFHELDWVQGFAIIPTIDRGRAVSGAEDRLWGNLDAWGDDTSWGDPT